MSLKTELWLKVRNFELRINFDFNLNYLPIYLSQELTIVPFMKNRDKLISFSHCYKQSWRTLFKTSLYFEFWSWLCGASISHPSKLVGSGLLPSIFKKSWKRFLFEAIGSREQWRFRYFSESQKRISMASKKYGSSLALLLAWKQSCRGLFKTKLENIITLILFPLNQLSIEKNRLGFTWNLNSSETWVLTHECYAWMYIQREYLYERLHRTIHSECTFDSVTKIWQLPGPDEF